MCEVKLQNESLLSRQQQQQQQQQQQHHHHHPPPQVIVIQQPAIDGRNSNNSAEDDSFFLGRNECCGCPWSSFCIISYPIVVGLVVIAFGGCLFVLGHAQTVPGIVLMVVGALLWMWSFFLCKKYCRKWNLLNLDCLSTSRYSRVIEEEASPSRVSSTSNLPPVTPGVTIPTGLNTGQSSVYIIPTTGHNTPNTPLPTGDHSDYPMPPIVPPIEPPIMPPIVPTGSQFHGYASNPA